LLYTTGELHGWGAEPFSVHRNVAEGSGEEKAKVDVREVEIAGGCCVTVVVGGVRSTVQVYVAGVSPVAFVLTANVCDPSLRPLTGCGDVHAANVPASNLHRKLAPLDAAWNVNVAEVLLVAAGGMESITASGAAAPAAAAMTPTATLTARMTLAALQPIT
jgi:hypothetical protein